MAELNNNEVNIFAQQNSDEAKSLEELMQNMQLNVKKETLNTVGAVSEQCAKEMSEGVAARHNTNIGLSTTGIAGPEGGSEDKPVGLVYMGITINNKTIVKKYIFNGNRQQIRSRACKTLLNDLRLELLKII